MDNPYYPYEIKKSKDKRPIKIKEEGIYIFGGKNNKGQVLNKLKILKLGTKPVKMIFPETHGIAPSPRFSHSMNYFE